MLGNCCAGPCPRDELSMRFVKATLWFLMNAFQAFWLGFYCFFCFLVSLVLYALTWNGEPALGLGRTIFGPVNVAFGFSDLVVEGEENFPKDSPFILMMNHQSMADIMIAWMIAPVSVRFIAKRQLLYVPVIGWAMALYNMVPIDRGNARAALKALKKAARILKNGISIATFPEGTRTKDGTIGPFKKGVFLLAEKSGVPIVPVALEGAGVFAPRKGWNPRPVTMRVKVGAPIPTDGDLTRDALIKKVRDTIIDMHLEIGGKGGDKENAVAEEARIIKPRAQAA
jgi:1-acyl-sn-glycerol-3-phosphate acyltransferase